MSRTSVPVVPRRELVTGDTDSLRTSARYFQRESTGYLRGWNPTLRESRQDINEAWLKAAGRAVEAIQNSGFLSGILQTCTDFVVGPGLRMSSRPNVEALGWDEATASKFTSDFEQRFRVWASDPMQCDAAGQMTLGQMQQAVFASYMTTGEALGFAPMIRRPGSKRLSKILLVPSQRLCQTTDETSRLYQGVRTDSFGLPIAYRIKVRSNALGWTEEEFNARDRDGRPLVFHLKEPVIGSTRNVSPMTPVLKVMRQYDQVFDAVVTKKLTQAMFAAVMRSSVQGLAAFDGLFTDEDNTRLDTVNFADAKGTWYDETKLDLGVHGRIAHLFPNDDLEFVESKGQGELQDKINVWLLRELCRGCGVTYETGTNDFNGATYSSIRMGSAIEWLTVIRRRQNIIVPFCEMAANIFLEEEIGSGRMEYPGGYRKFLEQREHVAITTWTGPPKPQADDFKAARSHEVLKDMGATTLERIHADYGTDWEDDMRQRARENDYAKKHGLPLPHSPKDPLETPEGQELELGDDGEDVPDKRRRRRTSGPKRKRSGIRPVGEPTDRGGLGAALDAELEDDLESELIDDLEADLISEQQQPEGQGDGQD